MSTSRFPHATPIIYIWVNRDGSTTRWYRLDEHDTSRQILTHPEPPVIAAIDHESHKCQIKIWWSRNQPHVELAFSAAQQKYGTWDHVAMDNCVPNELAECVLDEEMYAAIDAVSMLPDQRFAESQAILLLIRRAKRDDLADEVQRRTVAAAMPRSF